MATLSLKISDYMKDVWQEGMLNLFRRSSSNNANFRWDVLGSLTFITVHVPSIYYLTIQLKPWLLSTSFNYEAIFIFCNISRYYLYVFLEITQLSYIRIIYEDVYTCFLIFIFGNYEDSSLCAFNVMEGYLDCDFSSATVLTCHTKVSCNLSWN